MHLATYIIFNLNEVLETDIVFQFLVSGNYLYGMIAIFIPYMILPQLLWLQKIRNSKLYLSILCLLIITLPAHWFQTKLLEFTLPNYPHVDFSEMFYYTKFDTLLGWIYSIIAFTVSSLALSFMFKRK